ncbi:MAG TPA: hypothetical protein DDW27_09535 [Bacteroidales bacterium]|nr:hypothetical protein [Bacteroidales bacterium]
MKRMAISFTAVLISFSVSNAQFTKIGGGVALSNGFRFHNLDHESNRSGHLAAFGKGIYEINQPFQISPSFTIFIPNVTKDAKDRIIVSSMMIDINGHYVVNSLHRFEFYGLAGINILLAWQKTIYEVSPAFKESDNAIGLNAGAGTFISITEKVDLFAEIKYLISKYDQLVVNAGILISPGWLNRQVRPGK